MKYPYQNPNLPVQERVEDLLSRMSPEEKFAQIRLLTAPAKRNLDENYMEENCHRCGALYNVQSYPAETLNKMQKWTLEHNRWGIPLQFHGESLHGAMNENATVFPQSIGMGATFHRELIAEEAAAIGREVKNNGIHLVYAPNLDLSRDPRWGRTEETFGEDPYLTSELGLAYVKALQEQGVTSCVKHFIAHGSPESGINLAPVHAGQREFHEVMEEPFRKALAEGGAGAVMPAYSELDGEALHASKKLLTDLLREEYGFEGQVISDFGGITMLHTFHRTAETLTQAGEQALKAGVDMEAPTPKCYNDELLEKVKNGLLPEALVDRACRRVLQYKFSKGLFENPYCEEGKGKENQSPEALALALQAARESVVLLKNEGVLPLKKNVKKLAVIGPNGDNPQLGGYTPRKAMEKTVTLRKALEERLGKERVLFARGCTILDGSEELKAQALQAAEQADAVVMVMGDNSNYFGGIGWGDAEGDGTVAVTCGEGFDTHTLSLPRQQQELLEAVHALGKPMVLILETGRPYAITWAKEHIPAILQAWYPGQMGGTALAEILFGDCNPSGRLPISMPRSEGHLPCFYNHKPSAKGYYHKPGSKDAPGRDYVTDTPEALYPFGYGLSYTTFAYSNLRLPRQAGVHDTVEVSVTVENTGSMAGYEVVQCYVTDLYCRITPFVRRLRGFEKLWLEAGEKKTVTFRLGFEDFSFVNEELKREVEAGAFTITVGDLEATLTLN